MEVSGNSFPKSLVLRTEKDFASVLSEAHRMQRSGGIIRCDPFVVYKKPAQCGRLGISVAKKILKESPKRNRVKRVIREWFRHNKSQIAGDIVIRLMKRPDSLASEVLVSPLEASIELLKK